MRGLNINKELEMQYFKNLLESAQALGMDVMIPDAGNVSIPWITFVYPEHTEFLANMLDDDAIRKYLDALVDEGP